jgi:hypothetical protein
MPALPDPKLECFAQELVKAIACGVPRSRAAVEASRVAGYTGSSLPSNSRRRANNLKVRIRMAELTAPVTRAQELGVAMTVEWATKHLVGMLPPLSEVKAKKPADVAKTIEVIARLHGLNAPERHELAQKGTYYVSDKPTTKDEWRKRVEGLGEDDEESERK